MEAREALWRTLRNHSGVGGRHRSHHRSPRELSCLPPFQKKQPPAHGESRAAVMRHRLLDTHPPGQPARPPAPAPGVGCTGRGGGTQPQPPASSWGGHKAQPKTCFSSWIFTSSSSPGCVGPPHFSGQGPQHPHTGASTGPGDGRGESEGWGCRLLVRHKEVIEAFTICLTGDICFLQARRCAACRGTAALAHPSPSPPARREGTAPAPPVRPRGRRCLCGKGKLPTLQREINMRRAALTHTGRRSSGWRRRGQEAPAACVELGTAGGGDAAMAALPLLLAGGSSPPGLISAFITVTSEKPARAEPYAAEKA